MLEYTLELEAKAAAAGLVEQGAVLVMAFCGDGFTWREDELEDFVEFYRTSRHRPDDSFALAEQHDINHRGICLTHSISQFAYLARRQGEVRWRRLNWDVRPPEGPKGF
jgi:hypothetical protein